MIKIQRTLMAAFLFLTPLIYPLNDSLDLRAFQQVIYQYGAMILCTFFVRNIWLSLFFVWTILLYWLNGSHVGGETVFNIFLGIMLFGISRNFFLKNKFEDCTRWLIWVGIISMIFMIAQLFGIDPIHSFFNPSMGGVVRWQDFHDPVGMFMMKAHMGIFMAILTPIFAMINPLLGILSLVPVWYSDSTAAMMAGIAALLFYFFFHHRRLFWAGIAIGVIGLAFYGARDFKHAPEMYRSRWGMWHSVLRKTFERPIGYGPDSFRNVSKTKDFIFMGDQDMHPGIGYVIPDKPDAFRFMYYDPSPAKMNEINQIYQMKSPNIWDHPHNEYLNLLFCWGFPGLALFFMLAKEGVTKFMATQKTPEIVCLGSILLVYLLSSTTQFPMSVARLAYLFPIILGAFYASTDT